MRALVPIVILVIVLGLVLIATRPAPDPRYAGLPWRERRRLRAQEARERHEEERMKRLLGPLPSDHDYRNTPPYPDHKE